VKSFHTASVDLGSFGASATKFRYQDRIGQNESTLFAPCTGPGSARRDYWFRIPMLTLVILVIGCPQRSLDFIPLIEAFGIGSVEVGIRPILNSVTSNIRHVLKLSISLVLLVTCSEY